MLGMVRKRSIYDDVSLKQGCVALCACSDKIIEAKPAMRTTTKSRKKDLCIASDQVR